MSILSTRQKWIFVSHLHYHDLLILSNGTDECFSVLNNFSDSKHIMHKNIFYRLGFINHSVCHERLVQHEWRFFGNWESAPIVLLLIKGLGDNSENMGAKNAILSVAQNSHYRALIRTKRGETEKMRIQFSPFWGEPSR